jgi:hypothetical protein
VSGVSLQLPQISKTLRRGLGHAQNLFEFITPFPDR